jgi:drug/metabolite transporter (DMT)-like permease
LAKYRAWLLLFLCNAFWGGNYVAAKYVIQDISPFWTILIRWGIAVIFLIPLSFFLEKPNMKLIRKAFFPLAAMGAIGVIAFSFLSYAALEYTSPINVAFEETLIPAFIFVFSISFLREKFSVIQTVGLCISCLGVLIVLTNGELQRILELNFNRGDLLMLLADLVWVVYVMIGKKIKIPPITTTAFSSLFGVLMMIPFLFTQEIYLDHFNLLNISEILYMAIFAGILGFLFWNMGVRTIGATQAGVFMNFIPIFTVIIMSVLGESMTVGQIGGGLIIVLGVYLTTGMLDQIWLSHVNTKKMYSQVEDCIK